MCAVYLFLNPAVPTDISLGNSRTWENGGRCHVTGSARSEGYYVISSADKQRYLAGTPHHSERPAEDTQVSRGRTQ